MWLAGDSYWPPHSVLVHGDLHPPHILIDRENRVTGLADWTEAHVGDPAVDFALQFAASGQRPLAALLERYKETRGAVWPRMNDHVVEMWSAGLARCWWMLPRTAATGFRESETPAAPGAASPTPALVWPRTIGGTALPSSGPTGLPSSAARYPWRSPCWRTSAGRVSR
jgi:aminoglycoside phosphotransferase (APT) family kinase protein